MKEQEGREEGGEGRKALSPGVGWEFVLLIAQSEFWNCGIHLLIVLCGGNEGLWGWYYFTAGFAVAVGALYR